MKFVDQAKIYISSGHGGAGCVSFRREKYVPLGGPSGGDGGRGGSIVFIGSEGLKTLIDFKHKQHYKAGRGEHGMGKNMYGAGADDTVLKVPIGTVVRDAESGVLLADILLEGQKVVVAKGGRGGRGNLRFASEKDKAPQMAEKGEPGQERWLALELKLLADVGLVGFPNAGKSTLISRVSAARPKIGDYPFTTLVPNLGVVDLGEGQTFVVADLPGLIAGAHHGAGLGHRFLRHVERTRVLIHVLDMSEFDEERTPWGDFSVINDELRLYKAGLSARPQIIAANKMDSPEAPERLQTLREKLAQAQPDKEYEIFPISALTGEGLQPLLWRVWEELQKTELLPLLEMEEVKVTVVAAEDEWNVSRMEDGVWLVKNAELERLVAMTDMDNEEAVYRMQRIMDKMKLDDRLTKVGVVPGDDVRIGKEEFEFGE